MTKITLVDSDVELDFINLCKNQTFLKVISKHCVLSRGLKKKEVILPAWATPGEVRS